MQETTNLNRLNTRLFPAAKTSPLYCAMPTQTKYCNATDSKSCHLSGSSNGLGQIKQPSMPYHSEPSPTRPRHVAGLRAPQVRDPLSRPAARVYTTARSLPRPRRRRSAPCHDAVWPAILYLPRASGPRRRRCVRRMLAAGHVGQHVCSPVP